MTYTKWMNDMHTFHPCITFLHSAHIDKYLIACNVPTIRSLLSTHTHAHIQRERHIIIRISKHHRLLYCLRKYLANDGRRWAKNKCLGRNGVLIFSLAIPPPSPSPFANNSNTNWRSLHAIWSSIWRIYSKQIHELLVVW